MSASQQNFSENDEFELFECTSCGAQTEQILSLTCDHNLCIICAAKSVKRQVSTQNKFACQICGETTNLETSAYQILQTIQIAKKTTHSNTTNNCLSVSISSLADFKNAGSPLISCVNHSSEPAILYCYTCETRCFCLECYLQGNHKNHDVRNVQKSYDLIRLNKVELLQNQLRSQNDQLLNDQCRLTNKKKELIDLVAQSKLQIQNNFDNLFVLLEKKEKELLQAADEMVSDQIQEMDNMINKVKSQSQKFSTYSEELSKHFPETPPPLINCIESFNYISSEQKKIQKCLEEEIKSIFQPFLQLNYCLDLQSIEAQIENIQKLKLQVTSLRGVEMNCPTQREEFYFRKAQEERTKQTVKLNNNQMLILG